MASEYLGMEPERREFKGWRRGERSVTGLFAGLVLAAGVALYSGAEHAAVVKALPFAGLGLGAWAEVYAARRRRPPYSVPSRPEPVAPSLIEIPTFDEVRRYGGLQ